MFMGKAHSDQSASFLPALFSSDEETNAPQARKVVKTGVSLRARKRTMRSQLSQAISAINATPLVPETSFCVTLDLDKEIRARGTTAPRDSNHSDRQKSEIARNTSRFTNLPVILVKQYS